MTKLEILRPDTLGEAVAALASLGERARPLAGGTAVVLLVTHGLLAVDHLVDLGRIGGLDGIGHEPGRGLRLGSLVTHRAVERSPVVRERLPFLADVFHEVANVRVRNQATVGGVLAEADYASDPPGALVALGAEVRTEGPDGGRTIPVAELLRGHYETSLGAGELVTEVLVPEPAPGTGCAYLKYVSRSSEDRPCATVSALARLEGGRLAGLRVVVGAVAATPQGFAEIEQAALGEQPSAALLDRVADGYAARVEPLSDARGSSWYRRELVRALVRRAVAQAVERAT